MSNEFPHMLMVDTFRAPGVFFFAFRIRGFGFDGRGLGGLIPWVPMRCKRDRGLGYVAGSCERGPQCQPLTVVSLPSFQVQLGRCPGFPGIVEVVVES